METPNYEKPLKLDVVFGLPREPESALWQKLMSLENTLAHKLYAKPGSMVVNNLDAWVLRDDGESMVLCHATLKDGRLTNESSRFDFDLACVDIEPGGFEHYNARLVIAIDEFEARCRGDSGMAATAKKAD